MFLSRISLNPKNLSVRRDTSDAYRLHQRVMQAFPDGDRTAIGRVLYRLDSDRLGRLILFVQSEMEPDWGYLKSNDSYILEDGDAEHKAYNPRLKNGQLLRFRLRANPSIKKDGKRMGILKEDEQSLWLKNKMEKSGAELIEVSIVNESFMRGKKGSTGKTVDITLLSILFDGILRISEVSKFTETLKNGIGSAKGLGFGLLTISPV